MKNIALLIEYDGTNYVGWQIQPNGVSIQEIIENALTQLYKTKISIIGAGRTDAGVHARGQVANFIITESPIPIHKIPVALNSLINDDIKILSASFVSDDFNARYSAIAREYIYILSTKYSVFDRYYTGFTPYELNIDKLFEIADIFLGEHDFTAFSKHNPDTKSYVCNVQESFWQKIDDNKFLFKIIANRFVYGMVRSIVGTMIDYARGFKSYDFIKNCLDNKTREKISALAPASGLYLNKIYYDNNIFIQ